MTDFYKSDINEITTEHFFPDISLTVNNIPDISLTCSKFPDISRFPVVTLLDIIC